MTMSETLAQRFGRLCSKGDLGSTWHSPYDTLYWQYTDVHRKYHSLEHIEQCLLEFDSIRNLLESPDDVELAILYHDFFQGTNDVARSALFASRVVATYGMGDPEN